MCLNPPVRVPVIQRVRWCWRAGSPASHSSLFFPVLLALTPHTVTFLFPISTCYMHCFPSFLPLPGTVLCKPSVFLSRLILRHRETQISPLSTHSRLVEVQLMKLTLNLSNLSHFWNPVTDSLSTMCLSFLPKGTSHRFLAVKEWQLLWNMTVVLIAHSTATAGRLKREHSVLWPRILMWRSKQVWMFPWGYPSQDLCIIFSGGSRHWFGGAWLGKRDATRGKSGGE